MDYRGNKTFYKYISLENLEKDWKIQGSRGMPHYRLHAKFCEYLTETELRKMVKLYNDEKEMKERRDNKEEGECEEIKEERNDLEKNQQGNNDSGNIEIEKNDRQEDPQNLNENHDQDNLIEVRNDDVLLKINESGPVSNLIANLKQRVYKKRFDEERFALFEVDKDILMENFQIKHPFRNKTQKTKYPRVSEEEYPFNLLKEESFHDKNGLFLCRLPRDSEKLMLHSEKRYEIWGKFYYGKFGMVFESLYVVDVSHLFTEPFLMVMNLMKKEGLLMGVHGNEGDSN